MQDTELATVVKSLGGRGRDSAAKGAGYDSDESGAEKPRILRHRAGRAPTAVDRASGLYVSGSSESFRRQRENHEEAGERRHQPNGAHHQLTPECVDAYSSDSGVAEELESSDSGVAEEIGSGSESGIGSENETETEEEGGRERNISGEKAASLTSQYAAPVSLSSWLSRARLTVHQARPREAEADFREGDERGGKGDERGDTFDHHRVHAHQGQREVEQASPEVVVSEGAVPDRKGKESSGSRSSESSEEGYDDELEYESDESDESAESGASDEVCVSVDETGGVGMQKLEFVLPDPAPSAGAEVMKAPGKEELHDSLPTPPPTCAPASSHDPRAQTRRRSRAHQTLVSRTNSLESERLLRAENLLGTDVGDDTEIDEDDEEAARLAWQARELGRLYRDYLERQALDRTAENEKRIDREMVERGDDESGTRVKGGTIDDEREGRVEETERRKGKFMQKYYHKGAFYQDVAASNQDDALKKDFSISTQMADNVDKKLLPKILQTRGDDFGKRSRSKHTHLADVDTTNPRANASHDGSGGALDDQFTRRAPLNTGASRKILRKEYGKNSTYK